MSPRSPWSSPAFRAVWLASVLSFIGTWVQDVGESWVMLSMSRDPRLVALLTTCFLAPMLALTLPAGVLADRHDRRTLLLWSQGASALAAVGPAVALRLHAMTPVVLLVCTGLLGAAGALGEPAWKTLVPELLPRELTAEAITLGSIAFNLARVVGPALGGVLLAMSGAETTFIVNALSFVAVLWVLARHDEVKLASRRTGSRASLSLVEPLREVWHTPLLRTAFMTVGAFAATGCSLMAILPAFAKHALGASASGYGVLLSALGAGAITSGVFLSRLRARLGKRRTVALGVLAFGVATLLASLAPGVASAAACFYIGGLGWIACFTTLAATVQLTASKHAKSRVTALYQLNFYAWAAVGASLGGVIAKHSGERAAVLAASVGSLVTALCVSVAPLYYRVNPMGPSTK
jgi:MFS family permease